MRHTITNLWSNRPVSQVKKEPRNTFSYNAHELWGVDWHAGCACETRPFSFWLTVLTQGLETESHTRLFCPAMLDNKDQNECRPSLMFVRLYVLRQLSHKNPRGVRPVVQQELPGQFRDMYAVPESKISPNKFHKMMPFQLQWHFLLLAMGKCCRKSAHLTNQSSGSQNSIWWTEFWTGHVGGKLCPLYSWSDFCRCTSLVRIRVHTWKCWFWNKSYHTMPMPFLGSQSALDLNWKARPHCGLFKIPISSLLAKAIWTWAD